MWRDSPRGRELAVVHRKRYDDWTLPKGKLKKGETWEQAALREVQEETFCQVRLRGFAGQTSYSVEGKPKVVRFWNMALMKVETFVPNNEIDDIRWLTIAEALEALSYPGEQALLHINQGG